MTRRVLARSISVLFVLTVMLAIASPAFGANDTLTFTYGVDQSSWYWTRQIDEEVAVDFLPPPAPAVVQRVRLPSLQDFATLPVAVTNGEIEKTSAINFDLFSRGVEAGSIIQKYTLTIVQEDGPGDIPTFNATDRMILACRIDDFWAAGEAELFEVQPIFDEGSCVEGKLTTPELPTELPTWTWDLSQIAAPWGEDPFASNGVLFRPKLGEGGPLETWQINLKIPSRDDVETPEPINEYEDTKDRVKVVIEYLPPPPEPPIPPIDGGFPPSTDFTPDTPVATPDPTPPVEEPGTNGGEAPVSTAEPKLPGYVWLLLPVGLVALSGVRSVILESAASTRPDGVIAAIRARNAERRGWTAGALDATRPSRLAAPFVALWAAIKADFANAQSKLKRKPS